MYNITLGSANLFSVLSSLNEVDYFELQVKGNEALLVTNSNSIYGEVTLPCTSDVEQAGEPIYGRIAVDLLSGMGDSSYCTLKDLGDDMEIIFYDEHHRRLCSSKFVKQVTTILDLKYKYDQCREVGIMSKPYNVDNIRDLVKIGKDYVSIVTVEAKVAHINLPANGRMFKEIDSDIKFSVGSTDLLKLMKVSNIVRVTGNKIFAESKNIKILVTMSNPLPSGELELIKNAKNAYTVEIDFSNILHFISKFKTKLESVSIDINTSTCSIEHKGISHEIDINLSGGVHYRGSTVSTVSIPCAVITSAIKNSKETTFSMRVCRTDIILTKGGMIIVFSKPRDRKNETVKVDNKLSGIFSKG